MDHRGYLLAAYEQQHPDNIDEFLATLDGMFGKGSLLELHRWMCKKYGPPKLGTGRVAYIGKTAVFKVPISQDGFRQNDWEGSIVSLGEDMPIARSRLFYTPLSDIPIVVMEKVEEVYLDEIIARMGHIPEFVSAVDMGQVGFTRKGQLVAFDYAS